MGRYDFDTEDRASRVVGKLSAVKGFFSWKTISTLGTIGAILIVLMLTMGINQNGFRQVVQWPNGTTFVKFSPGVFFTLFGSNTEYPDVITFDYDKNDSGESTLNQKGIAVRYQDGGLGTIYGVDRFALPQDSDTMLKLHRAFRSKEGVATKLIKPVTEEATNLTAGLMTSEAAYAEQRATFIQWSKSQISGGKFKIELENRRVTDEQGKEVWKKVPVIRYNEDGSEMHQEADLAEYGVTLMGHQITDWDFEQKTLNQISTKREATMAIITAKANAERAKQDAITSEQQGLANVMKARYEKEVIKEQAIVDAARVKEVAVIQAEQKVDVAEQGKLEAEQKKLAAVEYKQEQILRGEGDGEYKRLVMEADGALQQKLETYKEVSALYARAISTQKWVPEIQMGAGGSDNGNAADALISLLTTKAAKDLSLDLTVKQ